MIQKKKLIEVAPLLDAISSKSLWKKQRATGLIEAADLEAEEVEET